jgi:hypothetical protein
MSFFEKKVSEGGTIMICGACSYQNHAKCIDAKHNNSHGCTCQHNTGPDLVNRKMVSVDSSKRLVKKVARNSTFSDLEQKGEK